MQLQFIEAIVTHLLTISFDSQLLNISEIIVLVVRETLRYPETDMDRGKLNGRNKY